eukprot:3046081-Rhodomonas_salina.1
MPSCVVCLARCWCWCWLCSDVTGCHSGTGAAAQVRGTQRVLLVRVLLSSFCPVCVCSSRHLRFSCLPCLLATDQYGEEEEEDKSEGRRTEEVERIRASSLAGACREERQRRYDGSCVGGEGE